MAEQYFPAKLDQLEPVQKFVLDQLRGSLHRADPGAAGRGGGGDLCQHRSLRISPDQTGVGLIRCQVEQGPLRIQIQFVDAGVPFNPLAKKDADITLSAEERHIGGLGILMVKRSMDAADYVYSGGNNILTLTKYL